MESLVEYITFGQCRLTVAAAMGNRISALLGGAHLPGERVIAVISTASIGNGTISRMEADLLAVLSAGEKIRCLHKKALPDKGKGELKNLARECKA